MINYQSFVFLAITVTFSQLMYTVIENPGSAQSDLVFSNPSSTDIILEVYNTDVSATGEYCSCSMLIKSDY